MVGSEDSSNVGQVSVANPQHEQTSPCILQIRLRLEFVYDARHRRIAKVVNEWDGDAVTGGFTRVVRDRRYVYDGWNMIAELDHTTATGTGLAGCGVVRTQVWGEDLSGTMQGAGGVGGLLMVRHGGQSYVPLMDGNGNVMGLQGLGGAKDGQTVARYDYDAFGNRITNTAPELGEDVCPFGFSTKLTDGETGLVYYGYRYYAPEVGRWVSRDPIGERGGLNLYGMCFNDPVNWYDYLGRDPITAGIYDGKDPGGPGRANGDQFAEQAKRISQIQINAQDLGTAVNKLKTELEKKRAEYEAWAAQIQSQGMKPEQFGRTPPTLTKVVIIDHGSEGSQELGNQPIDVFGQDFQNLSRMIVEEGTLVLSGCECGKGEAGQGFIENAAVMSNRRTIGYKVLIVSNGFGGPSSEDTVLVDPSEVNRQNTSGFWPRVLDAYKQVFKQTDGKVCPIRDPKTGKIPAHLESR